MDNPVRRRKRARPPEATRLEAADWVDRGLEVLARRKDCVEALFSAGHPALITPTH